MAPKKAIQIKKIVDFQRKFVKARDWENFHTPKNLAMALAGEAGELVEIFQWLTQEESLQLGKNKVKREMLADELADIFYYLVRIADKLEVDLEDAFWKKMKKNTKKYPVKLAKGSAKKYNEY